MKKIWIDHQRFLLLCGSGLLVFLLGNWFLSGLGESAEKSYANCQRLQGEIVRLHKELERTYAEEVKKVASYASHEKALAEQFSMPADAKLDGSSQLLIAFNKKVDAIWAGVQGKASQRGLRLPPKLTAEDFGIESSDGPVEYAAYHSYLDVLGTALRVLVEAGMTSIERPELLAPEETRVRGSETHVCLYRRVSFSVTGPYSGFVRCLELAQNQKPGRFLSVRLRALRPVRSAEAGELRARVEVAAFRLEPLAEASDAFGGAGGGPGGGSGSRRR